MPHTPSKTTCLLSAFLLAVVFTTLPCFAYAPGDMNCDGLINFDDINPFVLVLSDPSHEWYSYMYPLCDPLNGDINADGIVDFADINPFVELLAGSGPRLAGHRHTDCDPANSFCPPDVVELTPSLHSLAIFHRDATYNCGLDDIEVELTVQPGVLHFEETEIVYQPANCMCCWDVCAWAIDLDPGPYTVEYRWFDWDAGGYQVDTQQVEIP